MKKAFLLLCAVCLLFLQGTAAAQDPSHAGIPDEVYYLMPSFGNGMVFFRGQLPAQGELNICALDNTLRYKDPDGTELAAADISHVTLVQIDTVFFIYSKEAFYRRYPVSPNTGVAVRRHVRIMTDVNKAPFGGTSMTSSVTEYTSIYADGLTRKLEARTDYPYDVQERVYIYRGDEVYPITKKNLKKVYPEKKEEIEAWFKEGNSVPYTLEEALPLLARWAQ